MSQSDSGSERRKSWHAHTRLKLTTPTPTPPAAVASLSHRPPSTLTATGQAGQLAGQATLLAPSAQATSVRTTSPVAPACHATDELMPAPTQSTAAGLH